LVRDYTICLLSTLGEVFGIRGEITRVFDTMQVRRQPSTRIESEATEGKIQRILR
jgi:hypothetical protein